MSETLGFDLKGRAVVITDAGRIVTGHTLQVEGGFTIVRKR